MTLQPFNHPPPLHPQDCATKHPEPPVKRALPIGEALSFFFFFATVGVVWGFMGVMS